MRVKIKRQVTADDEIVVEFPVYVDIGDIFENREVEEVVRIDSDGSLFRVSKTTQDFDDRKVVFIYERSRISLETQLAAYLERPGRAAPVQFYALVEELAESVAAMPAPTAKETPR